MESTYFSSRTTTGSRTRSSHTCDGVDSRKFTKTLSNAIHAECYGHRLLRVAAKRAPHDEDPEGREGLF